MNLLGQLQWMSSLGLVSTIEKEAEKTHKRKGLINHCIVLRPVLPKYLL